MGVYEAGVAMVFTCQAEAPHVLSRTHPATHARLRDAWLEAYPESLDWALGIEGGAAAAQQQQQQGQQARPPVAYATQIIE